MSNQTYANLGSAIPYYGEASVMAVNVFGNPGGVPGVIGFKVWKVAPKIACFAIESTSPAIAWGGATQIDAAVGSIPVGFRPLVAQVVPAMLITTAVTIPPHAIWCAYIRVAVDGSFSVFKYNGQDGTVVQWSTNDQVGPISVIYITEL